MAGRALLVRWWLGLLGLAVSVPLPAHGTIAEQDPFETQYQRAIRSYLAERYAESLEAFRAAYALRPVPRLLISIGTVHRKLGQAALAIEAYETYARLEPQPAPEVTAKLQLLLAEAQALLTAQTGPPAAQAAPHPATGSAPAPESRGRTPGGQPAPSRRPRPNPPGAGTLVAAPATLTPPFELLPSLPTTEPITGLAAAGPQELWAVAGPRVYRFDGQAWTTAYREWGSDLNQIWGARHGGLWAVGSHGLVLSYDGTAWHPVPTGTDRNLLCGIEIAGQLQVMDEEGRFLRLEGTEWWELDSGWPDPLQLVGCTMVGSQDRMPRSGSGADLPEDRLDLRSGSLNYLYAVGYGGTVVRWDGTRLLSLVSGTSATLSAIWGSSIRDLWAVGEGGTLIHFDGQRWSLAQPPRTDRSLLGVWGSGPTDIWAVGGVFRFTDWWVRLGQRGRLDISDDTLAAVWHYDGQQWRDSAGDLPGLLQTIGGSSARDVHALGWFGTQLHHDGEQWLKTPRLPGGPPTRVWSPGPGELWAVGQSGTILHRAANHWSAAHTRTTSTLRAILPIAADDVWAAGKEGTLLHFDGRSWTRADWATPESWNALWASGPHELFAAGAGQVLHFDGQRWSAQQLEGAGQLEALWGSRPGDLWAAGARCRLYHHDGRRWTRQDTSALPVEPGLAGRLPPLTAKPRPPLPTAPIACRHDLRTLWGSGPDDVWAAGDGILLHRSAQGWAVVEVGPEHEQSLPRSWGRGQELWLAASTWTTPHQPRPGLLHFDGRGWEALATDTAITALAGLGDRLWLGGADGSVRLLRLEPGGADSPRQPGSKP